ncbi:MAG: hypothetical protein HYU97_03370 [Deltaproteobacteria bacterium]|nr:hypothetical protein [Deltaproteobacteria bacterium]
MSPLSHLVGRKYELGLLQREYEKTSSSLIVLYGRRRIGKTRLITEFYEGKHLWKFDGVEGLTKPAQIKAQLSQLSTLRQDKLYALVDCKNWVEFFKILNNAILKSPHKHRMTLFFDELPYIAGRQSELIAALKWAWDNLWQDKPDFTLVLCGSIASFMIKKVVQSSALYGRISLEICLKALSMLEVSDFFGKKKSIREILNLYMFCGGVPEYLRQMDPKESIAQNIARLAFCKDGYFVGEFARLFKDVFAEEAIYKKIIQCLAQYKNLKVPELTQRLGVSAGGGFVEYLGNLESAGFIKSVIPWNSPPESKLKRYRLNDEYLLFYFKFIHPNLRKIQENTNPQSAFSYLNSRVYNIWAGFAFERLCLKHASLIMQHLQIDQLVKDYGAYFDRANNNKEGVQIDLLFLRHDPVVTLCEIKYHQGLIGKWIIPELEKKVVLLEEPKKTIERVLITTEGITEDLKDSQYFSRVLLADEIFG